MATDRTCTELIPTAALANDAGPFIAYAALRHVAFVVLEQLLQENDAPEITLSLTVRRTDAPGGQSFTAHGQVASA